jgi:hypothetical protein
MKRSVVSVQRGVWRFGHQVSPQQRDSLWIGESSSRGVSLLDLQVGLSRNER